MAPKDDLSRSETIFDRFREAVVLAKSLNFNVASALLHISQPTLTRHIANLERELGFKLFTRFPMALTPEGQYFIAATEKLIADYDKVIAQCRDMAKRSQEAIVINMVFASSSLWGNLVHHAVSQFHGRHPELPMPCFFQNRAIPIDASVFSGESDAGIVFREPSLLPDGCACQLLAEFPLAVYFSGDSPLNGCERVTLEDLSSQHLLCPTSPQLRATFDGAVDVFRRNGCEPRYRVREVNEFGSVPFLLAEDEFVFGNAQGGAALPVTSPLGGRPLAAEKNSYPVYLIYRTDSRKPSFNEFVQLCLDAAREVPRGEE